MCSYYSVVFLIKANCIISIMMKYYLIGLMLIVLLTVLLHLYSFNKYLLSCFYVSGTILRTGDMVVEKIRQISAVMELTFCPL